jgi:hypothetical protein
MSYILGEKMKKFIATVFISIMLISLIGCSWVSPDAGHESVLIKHPVFFGHGGVDSESVKPGLVFIALSTDAKDMWMNPSKYEVEMPDTMSSEGVPLEFHAVVYLQVTDAVKMVTNFGANDWWKNNLEVPWQQMIRQAVKKHGLNETAISTTAIESIDAEVRTNLESFIKEKGLPLRVVTMTVGKANPPDAVKNQRIETAQQEQRIQTEQNRKKAEDNRLAAETSRAAADNAYRESMHLSPEQFIQLENINMLREICTHTTCTFINGQAMPTVSVK